MSILPDLLRIALTSQLPINPERTAQSAQRLIIHAAGLLAAVLLGIVGVACVLTGAVLWMMPEPVTTITVILVMGGVLIGVGAMAWAIASGIGETSDLIADLVKPSVRPLDFAVDKISHIYQAFKSGLEGDRPRT